MPAACRPRRRHEPAPSGLPRATRRPELRRQPPRLPPCWAGTGGRAARARQAVRHSVTARKPAPRATGRSHGPLVAALRRRPPHRRRLRRSPAVRENRRNRAERHLPGERHRAGRGRRTGLRSLRDAAEPDSQHAATGAAQDADARALSPRLDGAPRPPPAVRVACPAWRRMREPSPRDARPGGRAKRDRRPIRSKAAAGAAAAAALNAGRLEGAPQGPARTCARRDRPRARPARCNDKAAAAAQQRRGAAAQQRRGAAGRPRRRARPPNPGRCAARARGWRGRPPAASAPR